MDAGLCIPTVLHDVRTAQPAAMLSRAFKRQRYTKISRNGHVFSKKCYYRLPAIMRISHNGNDKQPPADSKGNATT